MPQTIDGRKSPITVILIGVMVGVVVVPTVGVMVADYFLMKAGIQTMSDWMMHAGVAAPLVPFCLGLVVGLCVGGLATHFYFPQRIKTRTWVFVNSDGTIREIEMPPGDDSRPVWVGGS